jgi:hypothetical protein
MTAFVINVCGTAVHGFLTNRLSIASRYLSAFSAAADR